MFAGIPGNARQLLEVSELLEKNSIKQFPKLNKLRILRNVAEKINSREPFLGLVSIPTVKSDELLAMRSLVGPIVSRANATDTSLAVVDRRCARACEDDGISKR